MLFITLLRYCMVKNIVLGTLDLLVKAAVLVFAIYIVIEGGKRGFGFGYELLEDQKATVGIMDVQVKIPKGASTEQIAEILDENGLVNNALMFRILSKVQGKDGLYQYGEYHLNTGMSDEEIMEALLTQGEKKETLKFTIPEGYTVEQIARKLEKEEICDSDDFIDAVNNKMYGYDFIDKDIDRSYKLQGYLFPATYEIYKDASAEDIVSKMLSAFDRVFKPEYYERVEELGLSIDEVIIIASIIEREIRVDSERELASAVIYNRMKIDMNLEMCSTIQYVLDKPRKRLLFSDLEIESPYNTYRNPGLPIGPICNPGARSIEAALYPADEGYLFFVLVDEETGAHQFNTDYNSHINAMNEHGQVF